MISYFIQTGLLFTLCWLFEKTVLNNDRSFNFRRAFVLSSLIIVPFIPFLSFPSFRGMEIIYYPDLLIISGNGAMTYANESISDSNFFVLSNVLMIIYMLGLIISTFLFIRDFYKIITRINKSTKETFQQFTLIQDIESPDPYSFFRFINLGKFNPDSNAEKQTILTHEMVHVKQWHSVDTILAALLSIIFWFIPPVHFLKNRLQLIHEYIADEEASKMTGVKSYCQLLLNQTQWESRLHISNTFNFKPLKKRIMMMLNKNQIRNSTARKLLIVPFLAICMTTILFSQKSTLEAPAPPPAPAAPTAKISPAPPAPPTPPAPPASPAPKVQKEIDEMPRFYSKECEKMGDVEERNKCANMKMMEFIYTNIKYPESARKNKIEGKVIVQFVVEKNGSISNIEVLKSTHEDLSNAALEPIKLMTKKGTFEPGKDKGEIVKAQLVLPINFKLD